MSRIKSAVSKINNRSSRFVNDDYNLAPLGYERSVHPVKADIHYRARNQRWWYFDRRVSTALTGVSGTIPGTVFMGTCSVCNSSEGYRVERNSASGKPGRVHSRPRISRNPEQHAHAPYTIIVTGSTTTTITTAIPIDIPHARLYNRERSTCQLLWGRNTILRYELSSSCPGESFPRLSPVHSDTIAS